MGVDLQKPEKLLLCMEFRQDEMKKSTAIMFSVFHVISFIDYFILLPIARLKNPLQND